MSILSIGAGVLASLFANDIIAAHHLYRRGPLSWEATSFWIAASLAIILFFLGQQASDTRRKHSEDRLDRRANELAELVRDLRTLPPADFLWELGRTFRICEEILATVQGEQGVNPSEVQAAIRQVLQSLASLAHKFDAAPPAAYYAANIMRFRPAASIPADEQREMKEKGRLFFCEPTTDVAQLDGVLELDRQLSAQFGDKGDRSPNPEEWLVPLTLPVPQEKYTQSEKRWRVLPGAPMAFVKARSLPGEPVFDAYADTKSLADFCRAQKEFSETVVRQIEEYYSTGEPGKRVVSFVSFALESHNSPPMGVLNIHADTKGILGSLKGTTKQFAYLIEPLLSIVLELIRTLEDRVAKGA